MDYPWYNLYGGANALEFSRPNVPIIVGWNDDNLISLCHSKMRFNRSNVEGRWQ